MADRFVQSFLAISDPSERQQALTVLVNAISFADRQALCTNIHHKNDIVARLPNELLLEVFSYLNLYDVWTLRLVNQRWRRMLSSEDVLRASLARWDSHDPEDSVRPLGSDPIPEQIRHVQALRHGKPFTQDVHDPIDLRLQEPGPRCWQSRVSFKRDKIAYVSSQPDDGDTVVIRDLVTGGATRLRGSARERIMMLTLTRSVVAFVTFDGIVYSTQISDNLMVSEMISVQLPSAWVRAIGGQGDRLAFAMGAEGFNKSYVNSILTYDVQSRRLLAFSVEAKQRELEAVDQNRIVERRYQTAEVLVNSPDGCIDLFAFYNYANAGQETGRLLITHLRVSLQGEILNGGVWEHTLLSTDTRGMKYVMLPPRRTGQTGEHLIQIGLMFQNVCSPPSHMFDVYFDSRTASFRPPQVNVRYCHISNEGHSVMRTRITTAMYAQWKDMMIATKPKEWEWGEFMTLMNDSFLVVLDFNRESTQRSRIRVFCFDEKLAAQVGKDCGLWDLDNGLLTAGISELEID